MLPLGLAHNRRRRRPRSDTGRFDPRGRGQATEPVPGSSAGRDQVEYGSNSWRQYSCTATPRRLRSGDRSLPSWGETTPSRFLATLWYAGAEGLWRDRECVWPRLAAELDAMGGSVDLVGHDWGANHVLRLACDRSEQLR